MLLPVWESHWGIGNFREDSSACRRRVDRLADPILALATLFAAQKEQTKTDWNRMFPIRHECFMDAKKDSLPQDSESFLLVAEAGLEPTTSGL